MRIEKTIKGEKYFYYVYPIYKEMAVNVKYFMADELVKCNLTEDFKYILLPDSFDKIIDGEKAEVRKLKVPKGLQRDLKEYQK
jgi:hypothetical protein